jgi:eukaryotic-like serine/threonine-protein kinase
MGLGAGTRLGPYEITGPLGSGGMGEVYKARDMRLDREVAIKVLPASFATDADRLQRFETEAKATGQLNHPNVVSVYDVGTHEDAPYLVTELLDGQTLRERLASGPMPLRKALQIGVDVAHGLAAAHARGIVHRDLKPENLFLTRDGRVKILDFGLAKATAPASAGPAAGASAAATALQPTDPGTVLGTIGYMSPEQVRGQPADARSDLFAVGTILYEMLSGARPFARDSAADTMAAILNAEPPEFSRTAAPVPPAVDRVIRRSLEKDPEERFQSARDLAFSLEAVSGASSSTSASGAAAAVALPATARPLPRQLMTAAAGLVMLAAGVAIGRFVLAPAGLAADRPPIFTLTRLTDLPGPERQPDISPDGRQFLYASAASGNYDIYLMRIGGARAIDLTPGSPADDDEARFSPSGDQIVFRSERDGGGLFIMGATGESVRRLTAAGYDPAWSPDAKSVAYSTEGIDDPYSRNLTAELWTVEVATGKTTKLYAGDAVQPAWSPDGRRIAFWANTGGQRDIWTIPAAGGQPVAVTSDPPTDWSPEWSPDGRWLYFSSDRGGGVMNIWRVAIDQDTGQTRSAPQPVTNGLENVAYPRFAAEGSRMTVMSYDRTFDLTVADFDPARPQHIEPRTTLRHQTLSWCSPSPDGVWLACTSRGAQEDIVLLRSDGGETRRLMNDPAKDREPVWSPDGKTLDFFSTRSGRWQYWRIAADGSSLQPLTDLSAADNGNAAFSPDGREIIVTALASGVGTAWRSDLSHLLTDQTPPFYRWPHGEWLGASSWSPSGSLVAGAVADESGVPTGYGVWDLQTGSLRKLGVPLDPAGAIEGPVFLPDSRHVLIPDVHGLIIADVTTGEWHLLRPGDSLDKVELSRDGRTLVLQHDVFDSDVWLVDFTKPPGR